MCLRFSFLRAFLQLPPLKCPQEARLLAFCLGGCDVDLVLPFVEKVVSQSMSQLYAAVPVLVPILGYQHHVFDSYTSIVIPQPLTQRVYDPGKRSVFLVVCVLHICVTFYAACLCVWRNIGSMGCITSSCPIAKCGSWSLFSIFQHRK